MKFFALIMASTFIVLAYQNCQNSGGFTAKTIRGRDLAGDMILDSTRLCKTSKTLTGAQFGAKDFYYYESAPWPGGVMPLKFTSRIPTSSRTFIFEQCAKWSEVANVKCVPYTSQSKFMTVDDDSTYASNISCNSYVGQSTGAKMNLPTRCMDVHIVLHELGHAFGLIHEHQRSDRDTYIKINLSNVASNARFNFNILSTSTGLGAYDFLSIMHYHFWAGSTNGQPAIEAKSPNQHFMSFSDAYGEVGERTILSQRDGEAMMNIYGPPADISAPVVAGTITESSVNCQSGNCTVLVSWTATNAPSAGVRLQELGTENVRVCSTSECEFQVSEGHYDIQLREFADQASSRLLDYATFATPNAGESCSGQ